MKKLETLKTSGMWVWGALSGALLGIGIYGNVETLYTVGYFSTACFVAGILSWLIVKFKERNV